MGNTFLYNEKELLSQVAAGDVDAFTVLYERYRNKVYYIAYKLLHSEVDAKDVLQDVYLKMWQNRSKLAGMEHFPAYLNTLTRNHIYDQFRKKANEDNYLQQLFSETMQRADDVFDEVLYRALLKQVQEAAKLLPPQQRKVFEMSRLEGLKHEAIATQLKISRETVKKHLMEALKTIKASLLSAENGTMLLYFFITRL